MNKRGPNQSQLNMLEEGLCTAYGINPTHKRMQYLIPSRLEQLYRCKDEMARRILLGVSK